MANDNEAYLRSKIDLLRLLLKRTHSELNAVRYLVFLLSLQQPQLDLEKLLQSCREDKSLQEETEKEFVRLEGLLDKYDSTRLDEALAAFEKWNPPDAPSN
jgi:hypothetical protein